MMRKTIFASLIGLLMLCGTMHAQAVIGGSFNQYMANQPAGNSVGLSSPIPASSITDATVTMNMKAFPIAGNPVAMLIDRGAVLGSTIIINAWSMFNLQLDIRDKGNNGYSEQILFSGFDTTTPSAVTAGGGVFTATASIPACTVFAGNSTCITGSSFDQFEISSQGIVVDPTKAPFNLNTTPATQGTFDNGYKEFTLMGEGFGTFNFKQGFVFRYYGMTYSQAFVSANGFVSFGQTDTGFPDPTVNDMRLGVRRIASFYNDLVPEHQNATNNGPAYPNTRIYAQQFKDATGLTKVKFVHDHIAEFSNATGPHGGEIIITDNDDIAVFVPGYNGTPSINTAVGITPGNGIDPNVPGFGRDLDMLHGTLFTPPGTQLGRSHFEVFDHGPGGGMNNIDLIGFANNSTHPVGPGIVFLKDTTVANTTPTNSRYIIQ